MTLAMGTIILPLLGAKKNDLRYGNPPPFLPSPRFPYLVPCILPVIKFPGLRFRL